MTMTQSIQNEKKMMTLENCLEITNHNKLKAIYKVRKYSFDSIYNINAY